MTVLFDSCSLLAYIGPGGGVALLGPLLGVVAAVLGALAMVAAWPLRMMWKRVRGEKKSAA